MTAETMEELPNAKQAEVYDFVRFLKSTVSVQIAQPRKKKASIRSMIGIGKSNVRDGSINHDKYIYDKA
jgi:hypothetical protein